jgi:hypothetical protein
MIIHDLRVEHAGLVAQIDHLLINRFLDVWVCESKHFAEGVTINEHGEFTAFFGNKPYGVPSPIEQNNRHVLILQRLFDAGLIRLPTRLGFTIKPNLKSLVLVSKGARIGRPKAKVDGIDAVIKNDQLFKTIDKAVDESNLLLVAKLIGRDTLLGIAREIVALHRPAEFDWAAKFGISAKQSPTPNPGSAPATVTPVPPSPRVVSNAPVPSAPMASVASENSSKTKQKLVCQSCGEQVPYNVAKFCWFNKPKFGGNIYCMNCQKNV